MNYDKLSRSLRYYYEKGIMQKGKDFQFINEGTERSSPISSMFNVSISSIVAGERYVYKFVCTPEALFSNMAYSNPTAGAASAEKNVYFNQN